MSEQPAFTRPPVVEVVAAATLEVRQEHGPLLAAFWKDRLRTEFPLLEQHAPYSPQVEQFGPPGAGLSLQWNVGIPPVRLWALSSDGQQLLQLQPGWFACNWRKVLPQSEYDRWPSRRTTFERWFRELCTYLATETGAAPAVRQCEVTYINHIRPGGVWTRHADFERILNVPLGTAAPFPLEQVAGEVQFLLGDAFEPRGRLHVKVLPAFDPAGTTPLYVLELTARGAPAGEEVDGVLEFMDEGRAAINSAFLALTTAEMHREWGLVP